MQLLPIAAVATEPISLATVKAHLRLDSGVLSDNVSTSQTIIPASHGISTVTGTSVDVLGSQAIVNFNTGTFAGSAVLKIQESDNGTSWSDWYTFDTVTAANDNAVYEKEYTGTKRYIRGIAAVTVGACIFGVDVLLYNGTSIEDSLLSTLIKVAREWCETFTNRALASQTWEMLLDDFPAKDFIDLPKTPIQSVTSVKYKDSTGTETTMTATTDYIADVESTPGKVFLPYAKSWPSATLYPHNAIRLRFVAGYTGTIPYILPKSIEQAMLLLIGHWYNNREAVGDVGKEIEFAVKSLLWPYRIINV
jgi:uncharacterized phiE125 gp8 family phage protein